MAETQLLSQQRGHDRRADRSWFNQTSRRSFEDVDVRKATVTDHHHPHAIVRALEQFDVRRQILGQQVVARQRHHGHFNVRVDSAGADARKVFQAGETPSTLQTPHVHGGITQHFAWRLTKRT